MNVGNGPFLYNLFPHNFRYFLKNKREYKYEVNMHQEMYLWEESKAGGERCLTPEFQAQLRGVAKGLEPL